MYRINARFSHEKRVKLILLCIATIFAVILMPVPRALAENGGSTGEPLPWGRSNLIRTSNTSDNFSVFELSRNTISARGMYADDRIRKLFIDNEKDKISAAYSMSAHKDGSYEAEITASPEAGMHKLVVKLNSGATMRYNICYDSATGWYFPVNGFEKTSRDVFDHIYEAPDLASALYLSDTQDPDEITTALEQIRLLAEQHTEGIEDDYEKARAISAFISGRVYYDHDAKDTEVDNSTIALYNVLHSGKTVCAGFANLFCAMAEAVGIDAVNIKGGAANDDYVVYSDLINGRQNHEWSAFYYPKEERWVWVDSCWDGAGNYKDGEWLDGKPKIMYFDITDEAFSLNHRADKAERRHYFSAKTETRLMDGDTQDGEGEKQSVITSQATEADEPEPADQTGETLTGDPAHNNEVNPVSDKNEDAVYITIIAALAAAVIAAGAILAVILVKGRKQ